MIQKYEAFYAQQRHKWNVILTEIPWGVIYLAWECALVCMRFDDAGVRRKGCARLLACESLHKPVAEVLIKGYLDTWL